VTQADAALKVGQTMPEIVQRLVAKGLAKETATAVVIAVLEGWLRLQAESLAKAKRSNWIHRVLSAIVGGACFILMDRFFGGPPRKATGGVLVIVACIWFPNLKFGYISSRYYTPELPGAFVRWCAWFALVIAFFGIMWLGIFHRN
jgi:hypothetical protein